MPVPIARWNPARSVWETNETLICGHSDVWSETWPSSGMWADGLVYELPTSVPHTDGSGSSSSPGLLPTPESSDATGGRVTAELGGRRPSGAKRAITLATRLAHLLPTPTVSDTDGAGAHGTGGPDLRTALSLLPTPKATDGTKGGPNQRGSSGDLTMPSVVHLLPTHRVSATRTGRSAALRRDSMSGPSLDQALEIAQGILPREFMTWEELPPSWHGDRMPLPSSDGSD